jgi:hypothetical protein
METISNGLCVKCGASWGVPDPADWSDICDDCATDEEFTEDAMDERLPPGAVTDQIEDYKGFNDEEPDFDSDDE